jgi:O-antigen ligase
MAPMSIGIGVVLLGLFLDRKNLRSFQSMGFGQEILARYRTLGILSLALSVAVLFSLIGAKFNPLEFKIGSKAYGPELNFWFDLSKVWYLFWPFVLGLGWLNLNMEQQEHVLKTWWSAALILCGLGCLQFFTGLPRPQPIPNNPGFYHVIGLFGHHLSFANIVIFPFFFGFYLYQTQKISLRAFAFGGGVMLLALVGTFSRTLWLALPLAVFAASFGMIPRKFKTVFVMVSLIIGSLVFSTPMVQKRVFSALGTSDRYELWKANWEFFKLRPLTGVGFKHNLELSGFYFKSLHPEKDDFFTGHAHNMVLESLSGMGLLGFVSWFLLMGFYLVTSVRVRHGKWYTLALIVFLINGMTQVNFWEAKVFHTFMWSVSILFFVLLPCSFSNEVKPKA